MVASSVIFLSIGLRYASFLMIIAIIRNGMLTLVVQLTGLAIRLQLLCLFSGAMTTLLEAAKTSFDISIDYPVEPAR